MINEKIRAITLWQPYASLIAFGLKQFETRIWQTNYRGKLLIHAAQKPISNKGLHVWYDAFERCYQNPPQGIRISNSISNSESKLPLGKVIAIADLTDCIKITANHPFSSVNLENSKVAVYFQEAFFDSPEKERMVKTSIACLERAVGNWNECNYAWKLENVIELKNPIEAKGYQKLWYPDQTIISQLPL